MEDGVRADSVTEYVIPRKRFPVLSSPVEPGDMRSLRAGRRASAAGSWWDPPPWVTRKTRRQVPPDRGDAQYIGRSGRN